MEQLANLNPMTLSDDQAALWEDDVIGGDVDIVNRSSNGTGTGRLGPARNNGFMVGKLPKRRGSRNPNVASPCGNNVRHRPVKGGKDSAVAVFGQSTQLS